jgi:hypothetical protein
LENLINGISKRLPEVFDVLIKMTKQTKYTAVTCLQKEISAQKLESALRSHRLLAPHSTLTLFLATHSIAVLLSRTQWKNGSSHSLHTLNERSQDISIWNTKPSILLFSLCLRSISPKKAATHQQAAH